MTTRDDLHPEATLAASQPVPPTGPGETVTRPRAILSTWLLSLAIHAGILAAMLLMVFPYSPQETPYEPFLVRGEVIGRLDNFAIEPGSESSTGTTRDAERRTFASGTSSMPGSASPEVGVGTAPTARAGLAIIGVDGGASGDFNLPSAPKSDPLIPGALGGGAADFDDLGLGSGGGGTPRFFGLEGTARETRKIVYVVDRSGSMNDTFQYVRAEIRRSVGALRRSQKFHVILFNYGEPLENPPKRLVNAIDENKRELFEFLSRVTTAGSTEPERALQLALSLEPDIIYLLSDGIDFERGLLAKLDEWNRKRRTKIFVIGYLDRDGSFILEQIARAHGGEFKFVSDDDLPE